MTKHIFFLRHFETKNNVNGILNGQSLEEPISAGHCIEKCFSFDIIYCSTALRCRQTVEWIEGHNKIFFSEQLLERNLGLLEGHSRIEMQKQYPELFDKNRLNVFATPPEGESYNEFHGRASKFWNWCNNANEGNVMICSHNQMLKMLYFVMFDKTLTRQEWEQLCFPHGKIIKIM